MEDFEYVKQSRVDVVVNIKAERKMLSDVLRSKPCVVFDDKRKQKKHSKRDIEILLEEV